MRGACLVFLAACSWDPPVGGPTVCDWQGPPVTITTVDDEQLFGSARISTAQGLDGSESLYLNLCGRSGGRDYWVLTVSAERSAAPDAGPQAPLPLSQSGEIDFPFRGAMVQAVLRDGHVNETSFSGQLVASQGQLHGSVTWGDAGATATFDGGFAFQCGTNRPDPLFKTTFCQQFIGLASP